MSDITRAYGNAEGFRKHWGAYLVECGKPLVEGLPADAERILDIGGGTGGNVPAIAARAPRARIVAADFVENMIRLAPRSAARLVMDAQRLAFADRSFDGVLMAFMLFHVPDPTTALRETRRVLKAGGTIAIATWATEPHPDPAQHIWVEELDRAGAVAPDPSVMLHETMDSPKKLAALVRDAGFTAVETETRDFSDPMDEEEFIRRRTTLGSSLVRFGSLDADAQRVMLERARKRFATLGPGDFDSRERAVYAWAR
jgi:ubiquinone/menaquinone biosynthesis C-methylase UbiE